MDNEDEEFERFLRQFRLHEPGPLAEKVPVRRLRRSGWMLAAAVLVLVVLLPVALIRHFSGSGPHATIEAAGDSSYKIGERIAAGRTIRSGAGEGVTLALEDGSHIEMRSQSELLLERKADSTRIHLKAGGIIVSAAARQSAGHLSVESRDALASAGGAVFLVNLEQSGTRVAALQGEVEVRQRSALKRLLPGEQIATAPAMVLRSLTEEIAWSRNAAAHLALLPQPVAPLPGLSAQIIVQPIRPQPIVVEKIPVPAAPSVQPIHTPGIDPTRVNDPEMLQKLREEKLKEAAQARGPKKLWMAGPLAPQQQTAVLPGGPGKEILDRACSTCHVVDFVNTLHFQTRKEYADFVSRKMATGTSVSESEFPVLVDYLFDRLGRK